MSRSANSAVAQAVCDPDAATDQAPPTLTRVPLPPPVLAVGPREPSRMRGCRVFHGVQLTSVVFRIHAGRFPLALGRDEPVHFMLTGPELDTLIEHLTGVRAELTAAEARHG